MFLFIYLGAIAIIGLGVLVFLIKYNYTQKNQHTKTIKLNYALSPNEQRNYIDEAIKCSKNNSPASSKSFDELLTDGCTLMSEESFKINDFVVEGSGYHVV